MPDVSLEEFTEEVTAFFNANAKLKMAEDKPFVWGEGDDDIGLFEEVDREKEKVVLKEAQEWRAKRYDAGLGWITGPKEYGGRELTSAYERVLRQHRRPLRHPRPEFLRHRARDGRADDPRPRPAPRP